MRTLVNVNSKLLIERINSSQLSFFLKQNNLHSYLNKTVEEKLNYLHQKIAERPQLKEEFEEFLCEQAKYNNNRIVITIPIKVTSHSPLRSETAFYQSYPSYRDFNNIPTIDDNALQTILEDSPEEYTQVLDRLESENEQITCISKAFVKRKTRMLKDENGVDVIPRSLLDFVWIDVFPQKGYYRIHLSEKLPSTIGQLSFEEIYTKFSTLIENQYNVISVNHSAGHVFYKIYKKLTEVAESPYVKRVERFYNKIDDFVKEISADISYSDSSVEGINLNMRTKRLLERAIIQQDFQNYVETTINREGFVDKFQYQDSTGGRVLASSNDNTYDMSKHDIYFDTKETIDINKVLNMLWVRWFKEENEGHETKTNQIKVKYEQHSSFYITHFLFSHVSKEECEYVLPKFDKYEAE